MVHIAKYRAIQELYSPFADFSDSIEIELLTENKQPFANPSNPVLQDGEACYLRIKNKSSQPLNIAILDLEPTWAVSYIPIAGIDVPFYLLEANEEKQIHLRFALPSDTGYQQVQEVLKVFATRKAIDFRWLEMPSIDDAEPASKTKEFLSRAIGEGSLAKFINTFTQEESTITRAAVAIPFPSDEEWATKQLTITLLLARTS